MTPSPKAKGEAGNFVLPYLVLLFLVGLAQVHVSMKTGGLLHRLFTLGPVGRSVFCGAFRSLRTHALRGTWP